ncbi:MAG: molecular chaperone HtpG, partial [Pseudomonadota bacterium]
MSAKVENLELGADVKKVLDLTINALYQNRDIFVRELVSNASDAIDKLKYNALNQQDLIDGDDYKPEIKVTIDKEAKTITFSDNGIGMNRDDLISNIGTIASSGTAKFLEAISDKDKQPELIGQFGVGFYSAFLVAAEVTVTTKKAGDKNVWQWHSAGDGKYRLSQVSTKRGQGTEIVLKIKAEHEKYIDYFKLQHIIKTYSDHITTPIMLNGKDGSQDYEQVNAASALWTRAKKEVSKDEYTNFYRQVAYSADEPWLTLHNKNEGVDIVYTNLLFVPTNKPFDLFHPDHKPRVKLYVKKVFITDDQVQLIPSYLRFVRGIIDAENLPLNISRETLQHNVVIEKIKKNITKKIINELNQQAQQDETAYLEFWSNFGAVIKEGLCEHMMGDERDRLLKICRFASVNSENLISIDDYINNMPKDQKEIYYLVGNTIEQAAANPRLEGFKAKGIDVLL